MGFQLATCTADVRLDGRDCCHAAIIGAVRSGYGDGAFGNGRGSGGSVVTCASARLREPSYWRCQGDGVPPRQTHAFLETW